VLSTATVGHAAEPVPLASGIWEEDMGALPVHANRNTSELRMRKDNYKRGAARSARQAIEIIAQTRARGEEPPTVVARSETLRLSATSSASSLPAPPRW